MVISDVDLEIDPTKSDDFFTPKMLCYAGRDCYARIDQYRVSSSTTECLTLSPGYRFVEYVDIGGGVLEP